MENSLSEVGGFRKLVVSRPKTRGLRKLGVSLLEIRGFQEVNVNVQLNTTIRKQKGKNKFRVFHPHPYISSFRKEERNLSSKQSIIYRHTGKSYKKQNI